MYGVQVSRTFTAKHYLTVPDAGPEGDLHAHEYTVDACVRGPELNEHGYLIDIDRLAAAIDNVITTYQGETLNDLPAFRGENPSAERLARTIGNDLSRALNPPGLLELRITVHEDDVASVTHEQPV